MTRRDELLGRLPQRIGAARALTHARRELIVDEAITYAVLDHTEPLATPSDLERVFWTACEFRVKDALRGRSDTVRGAWRRESEEALAQVVDESDPAAAAEEAEEAGLVREFAETLAERERRVLRVKYFSGTAEPLGYKKIARHLGITLAAARAADRSIKRSLQQFAAVYTAGRLCPTREVEITALTGGTADRRQARLARAHVAHCPHCHATYAEQLRVIRSAAFERKVASLLPVAEIGDRGRVRGAWDAIADTLTRPLTHEGTTTAAQLAASGAGRGAGTIAVLKIAGACMASAGALGVCASGLVVPALRDEPPAVKRAPTRPPRDAAPVARRERLPTRAEQRLVPTPTPAPTRPKSSKRDRGGDRGTQGGTGRTEHEQTPASPAPANAASGGESEFDPTYQPSAPPAPAPAPAAPGGSEFF